MTYIIPLKVDEIVKKNEREVRDRLKQTVEKQRCPLQGYMEYNPILLERDEIDSLEALIGPACGWRVSVLVEKSGCYALRDSICYLQRSSRKQAQVSCTEECPVYQKVQRLLK